MLIIRGRGNNRRTFEMPCADIVKRSPEQEQEQGRNLLCQMLGIPLTAPAKPAKRIRKVKETGDVQPA